MRKGDYRLILWKQWLIVYLHFFTKMIKEIHLPMEKFHIDPIKLNSCSEMIFHSILKNQQRRVLYFKISSSPSFLILESYLKVVL